MVPGEFRFLSDILASRNYSDRRSIIGPTHGDNNNRRGVQEGGAEPPNIDADLELAADLVNNQADETTCHRAPPGDPVIQ